MSQRHRLIATLKQAICKSFDLNDWYDFGYFLNAPDFSDRHPRLLQNMRWDNPEYGPDVYTFLEQLCDAELARAAQFERLQTLLHSNIKTPLPEALISPYTDGGANIDREETGVTNSSPDQRPNAVFVVHGHNAKARQAMYQYLRALHLTPIDWEQAVAGTGKGTSASTLEIVTAGLQMATCVLVLFTPDEKTEIVEHLRSGDDAQTRLQPRPNVIFEAGLAMGIAPKRTIIAHFGGGMSMLSDLHGINYVSVNNSPESRNQLMQRLRTAGCVIEPTGLDYLNHHLYGDFDVLPKD